MVVGGVVLCSTDVQASRPSNMSHLNDAEGSHAMSKTNEFSPYLGDQFEIISPEGDFQEVTLKEVADRSSSVNTGNARVQQECFSLLFQGDIEKPLVQSTYSFRHREMGTFALFIVPVGSDNSGMKYEAVINRLVS